MTYANGLWDSSYETEVERVDGAYGAYRLGVMEGGCGKREGA